MTDQLWTPSSYKKAPPPKLGEAYGAGWGSDKQYLGLPGGGIVQFDLSQLTLADFRAMRDHYQVNASLSVLTFMMHQLDWQIECSNSKIADAIDEDLREIWTRLIRSMGQAYWAGFAPNIIQWENDVGKKRIVPTKIKDIVPENAKVNWREVDGYAPPGVAPPKLQVYDGIKIERTQFPVPPESTLWYPLLMENGDHYGRKLLRSAYTPWFFSTLIHLFANRYFERFGEPLPIGRADFDAEYEIDGKTVNGRQAMEGVLQGIRSRAVTVLPSDRIPTGVGNESEFAMDIKYLEGQMRGVDFERHLSRLDEEMSLALFTPLLILRTTDTGSYNLGIGHMQMYMWMLNALAGDLKEYIDRFLVKRMKDMNFGPNAPKAEWIYRPMGKENNETIRSVVQQLMVHGKVMPDLHELGQITGLTFTEVEQLTEEPAPADPIADGHLPGDADRAPQKRDAPRGVGDARATGRKISNRIAGSLDRVYSGKAEGSVRMGYRSAFGNALVDAGYDSVTAEQMATEFYERTEQALNQVVALKDSMPPEQMKTVVSNLIDNGIKDLVDRP
jgi:hypothetical protein